jgi:hypothetical protein
MQQSRLGNRIMTLSLTDSDTKIYKGKWVYVYDNNDREIEHLFYNQANEMISADYDGKGVLERTVRFIYKEFDAKGNWIKRVVSVWNPKLGTESQWAEYQTINYYP